MVEGPIIYNSVTGGKRVVGTRNIEKAKGIVSGTLRGSGAVFGLVSSLLRVAVDGRIFSISNQNFTLSAANGSNPRVDIAQVDTDGTITIKAGTAAASPACPSPDANNIFLAAVWVGPSSASTVGDMNSQTATAQAFVIAYYYMNGGLHASRVGVTDSPTTTSNTFVDADEMELPLFFPDNGFSYELCWDTVLVETYGTGREGAVITLEIDSSDKAEDIFGRTEALELPDLTVFKFFRFLSMHLNELLSVGAHTVLGRWHKDPDGTDIGMNKQQRRIWIHQVAQPEA